MRLTTESRIGGEAGHLPAEQTKPRTSDEDLLLRYCANGESGDFARLVQRYERELYSYLVRYTGSREMAEDVFQATFLQIHLKCEQFEEGRRFRPWLYTIATNQAIDAQRRNKRHRAVSLDQPAGGAEADDVGTLIKLLSADGDGPLEQLSAEERRDWVRGAIEALPEQLRSTIQLVYYQGLKYREAAEVMDIPVGTVKSRLHAAILKLNQLWKSTHVKNE